MTVDGHRPLVSIGVPVYNGELYLARALDSFLAQDFQDFEIIISDNASTDSTAKICTTYLERDERIHFYKNDKNIGLVGNFNRTFELSKGKYFKWAAHDDWHAPESLRVTVALLEENPSAVSCSTGVAIVDEHAQQFDQWLPTVDLASPPPHLRFHRLIWTLGEPHSLFGLMRSSALRQTALMQSYLGSDRILLAHMGLLGPIVHTPKLLHFYTVSETARRNYQPSLHYDPNNKDKLPLRTWRLIYKHLALVYLSKLNPAHKLFLTGSVLGRFGGRDFRRLAAEAYHSGRIIFRRAAKWPIRPLRQG